MSNKVFNLVVAVSGGVSAIASALVAFFAPPYTPAIVGAIGIVETAVIEVCNLFVIKESTKK